MSLDEEASFKIEQHWRREGTPRLRLVERNTGDVYKFELDMDGAETIATPTDEAKNSSKFKGLELACDHLERNGYNVEVDSETSPYGFTYST